MGEGGFLLALPAQSVAIRLVLGAVAAFVVVRWVLHANLRTARVRVASALVPVGVLVALLVMSLADPRLPTLMVPADGAGQVLLGLGNDYTYLVPFALPALAATWAVVSGGRICLRLVRTAAAGRRARALVATGRLPADVARLVARLADDFGVRTPRAAVVDCPGGAAAVGVRRPVLLLDAALLAELDPAEREGVIAHELAHIARRDNLIALAFGIARDLTFFVPGGTWAVRHLLVERELAADQAAITRTRRPGALAGGLMKVLDAGPDRVQACAALMPTGTLATRVAVLCDDSPEPGLARHTGETLALLGTFVLLVAVATVVPRALAGDDPDAALGLYVAGGDQLAADEIDRGAVTPAAAPPARALATYHDSVDQAPEPVAADTDRTGRAELADSPADLSAGMLRACVAGAACGSPEPASSTLELRPQPVLVEADIELRWHARQIAHSGDFRVYRLSSLRPEGAGP